MNPARLNPNRPKVPNLAPLIAQLYATDSGICGCCLHVVTENSNWDSAGWCLEEIARKQGHPLCIQIAEMMVQMTESQISRATERARKAGRS